MSVLSVCHGAISGAIPVSSHCQHLTRSVYEIITVASLRSWSGELCRGGDRGLQNSPLI
jgi:hypothetical protein